MFTRSQSPVPSGRRRGLVAAAIVGLVAYLILTALSRIWTDYLWFDSVGFAGPWWTRLSTSLGLGAAGVVVAFAVVWLNLLVADRQSLRYLIAPVEDDDEIVLRMREWAEPRLRNLRLTLAGGLALLHGLGAANWRDDLLLFLNSRRFGITDPLFGNDIGFYVFRLAFVSDLLSWVFNLTAVTAVLALGAHYLNGGIRWVRGSVPTFSGGAKAHLSVLLAVMALIRAGQYRLDTYRLLYTDRVEGFFGPGYTDVNARLHALRLLMAIAVVAALLFVINIWRRGWTLAVVSAAAWLVVAIGAGGIYPVIVDRFQVQTNPLARQRPYIAHNIEATRTAYGLAGVEVRNFPSDLDLTADEVENNRATIDNLRLWDPQVLARTYTNLQEIRQYYALDRVDTDRYMIDGELSQVMIAVRELDADNIPATDWQNTRLSYTHGFGAVVSPAAVVAPDGGPAFVLRDVPTVASVPEVELDQARIYFGETHDSTAPVVVRTDAKEFDFPRGSEETELNEYGGIDGVELSSIWRRVAMAIRYQDLNMLISSLIRPDSRVMLERNVASRVESIAPFLRVDGDPYPVVVDGRVVWIVDLYTTSSLYPYSQPVSIDHMQRIPRASGLRPGVNYIRNSVKATVDAYDGTVTLYVVDDEDPVVAAWMSVYPGMFTPGSQMPEEIRQHLRYPQDMFKLQTELYRNYHMIDAGVFFRKEDAWDIPPDPSQAERIDLLFGDLINPQSLVINYTDASLPNYLLMRLPEEDRLSYVLLQPLNPRQRLVMASFLLAEWTGAGGNDQPPWRLIDFQMPPGSAVPGLQQVVQRIESEPAIAQQLTLWRGQGSEVLQGNLLIVPVETSLLYVQPIYLAATAGALPKLQRVAVAYGDQVVWDENLDLALAALFGEGIEAEPPPDEPTTDVAELLSRAEEAFSQADAALRAGDLARYQQLIDEARDLIQQAVEALTGSAES